MVKKGELDKIAKELVDYSKVNISLFGNIPQKKLRAVEQVFKK